MICYLLEHLVTYACTANAETIEQINNKIKTKSLKRCIINGFTDKTFFPCPLIRDFGAKKIFPLAIDTLMNKFYVLSSIIFIAGDVDMEVLARVVETITDPSKMLGPQVCFVLFCLLIDGLIDGRLFC